MLACNHSCGAALHSLTLGCSCRNLEWHPVKEITVGLVYTYYSEVACTGRRCFASSVHQSDFTTKFCRALCKPREAPEEFAVAAKVGRFCLVSTRGARSCLHITGTGILRFHGTETCITKRARAAKKSSEHARR